MLQEGEKKNDQSKAEESIVGRGMMEVVGNIAMMSVMKKLEAGGAIEIPSKNLRLTTYGVEKIDNS